MRPQEVLHTQLTLDIQKGEGLCGRIQTRIVLTKILLNARLQYWGAPQEERKVKATQSNTIGFATFSFRSMSNIDVVKVG